MVDSIIPALKKSRSTTVQIANLPDSGRSALVKKFADALERNFKKILDANRIDAEKMLDSDPKKDRLLLDRERIRAIASDARNIAKLDDPTGKILTKKTLASGVELQKITTPLGVVGMIYESRPNVTADAISLAWKSGNAVVLRGGSDAENSNRAIIEIAHEILRESHLDTNIVVGLPTDRKFVAELLSADKFIDILIPRGSKNLIDFVRKNSTIPTIETGASVIHIFVDETADFKKTLKIIENSKCRRVSVCLALDTLLVHERIADDFLPIFVEKMNEHGVEIFADEKSFEICKKTAKKCSLAEPETFFREWLDWKISVKIVPDLDTALDHIRTHSLRHSECICTENLDHAERFLREVDTAIAYHNASTQFGDGAIFGLGAEIGISTQKLHARGPFSVEKLVCEKWILRGNGQIREP